MYRRTPTAAISKNLFVEQMKYYLSKSIIEELRSLLRPDYEHTGNILFDSNGNFESIVYKKSQKMDYCDGKCIVNFHTHPTDYSNFYPDHPSAKDIDYLLGAINHTTKVHLIITPLFIYVCYFKRPKFTTLYHRFMIYGKFEALAKKYDRSTQNFRKAWLRAINDTGLTVIQIKNTPFSISSNVPYLSNTNKLIFFLIILVLYAKMS